MDTFWRVMVGKQGSLVPYSLQQEIFGINYGFFHDLSSYSDKWEDFKEPVKEKAREIFPEKSKVAVGLLAGQLWNFSKAMQEGDIILTSDPSDYNNSGIIYRVGRIEGDYLYEPGAEHFIHQRKIN
jgi:predicted Mrr-cat superfamily restriction endonuclease